MTDVALVVGASSNLGYQVLKKLIDVYKGKIYFTTEDETDGFNILGKLNKDGVDLNYCQMDITYSNSIIKLRHHIQDQDERLDLIINNTEYKPTKKKTSRKETVKRLLSVNFYGYINFGKLIYPLLNKDARVVNISGPAGLLTSIENEEVRRKISNSSLEEDDLVGVFQEYEEAVRNGVEVTEGWGIDAHAISKVALSAVTFLQHREWSDKGIIINCLNPGTTVNRVDRRTSKIFEEGAEAILYLALESPLSLKGNYVWSNYSVVEWSSDPYVEITSV